MPRSCATYNLANWKALTEDTCNNEFVRRRQIHAYLTENGPIHPVRLAKWLYRKILHNDLIDPYLGLGKTLFENYPFRAKYKAPAGDDLDGLFGP